MLRGHMGENLRHEMDGKPRSFPFKLHSSSLTPEYLSHQTLQAIASHASPAIQTVAQRAGELRTNCRIECTKPPAKSGCHHQNPIPS